MCFLPLVYPELFERFHITPPKGVLFYGPPGGPGPRPHAPLRLERTSSVLASGGTPAVLAGSLT